MSNHTNASYTTTSMGAVLHLPHNGGMVLPVRLKVGSASGIGNPQRPDTDEDGRLRYALPGGGVYQSDIFLTE